MKLILLYLSMLIAFGASAQEARVYTIGGLDGGDAVIPASKTNTVYFDSSTNIWGNANTSSNLTLTVADFDYVGLTYSQTGTATSTNILSIFKSMNNGVTYEANASYSYTVAPGAAAYATNALLDLRGCTHIAFTIRSTGTTAATNALLQVNLKAPKTQTRPAIR